MTCKASVLPFCSHFTGLVMALRHWSAVNGVGFGWPKCVDQRVGWGQDLKEWTFGKQIYQGLGTTLFNYLVERKGL
jgi:hypothetical protein